MREKVAKTIIDSLEQDDNPSEWRERRKSEIDDSNTSTPEEYALEKWTENLTRQEAVSTEEAIQDLVEKQNEFTSSLIDELEERSLENEYLAAQNRETREAVEEESQFLKEGQDGLFDEHKMRRDEHDKIMDSTRRNLLKYIAGIGGGLFLADTITDHVVAPLVYGDNQQPEKYGGNQEPETGLITGEWNDWESVNDCFTDEQEEILYENLVENREYDSLNELDYRFTEDGSEYDVKFKDESGRELTAKFNDQNLSCEVE